MYPVNNINGIEEQEREIEGSHAVILLFVKPSDPNSKEIIGNINYLHHRSRGYCSIYLIGYSREMYGVYPDVQTLDGINHESWQYSDQCFIEVCDQLEKRLKNWVYSGEPEMILLQNSSTFDGGKLLDFRNYNYIDINYGIRKDYIDSFQRFMERIIRACRCETEANRVIAAANRKRVSWRKILEKAMEYDSRLPAPIKDIISNKVFFKTYRDNAAVTSECK